MQFSSKGWAMVAGLVIVAMVSQDALAQGQGQGRRGRGGRDGGMGFGGPVPAVRLLAAKEVQEALKLTDDQKTKLKTIGDEARDEIRKAMDDGGGRDKIRELMSSANSKVDEVLDAGQQKRLMGIAIQVNGPGAVMDPAVGKELNLTDDQKKQLAEVMQKGMEARRDAFRGGASEGGREKMEKLREDSNKEMMAVLTSDQQKQLESLKGDKVDIDMSQLRGPGGPGGGRDGERGRGRRGRDGNSESKSGDSSN